MSADFLPLAVGNHWSYEVVDESGKKVGELGFGVQDHTIISGRSFYVLKGFPFAPDSGASSVTLIRYDRQERYFTRMFRDEEGPLFLSDSATTNVLATDAAGLPLKFALQTDGMALTFQRGVGIVEARMETPAGVRIAKAVNVRVGEGRGEAGTAPGAVSDRAPAGGAPTNTARPTDEEKQNSMVATVTEQNPRLELTAARQPGGYRFTLTVTNTAGSLLPLRFASGQTYDFIVSDPATGREVWRWSRGEFFTQVVRSEAIRPKSAWKFEASWNGLDNEGAQAPAGKYVLLGIVASQPTIRSEPLTIDVE